MISVGGHVRLLNGHPSRLGGATMNTLEFRTRIVVDEIIAQLKSRQEVLQGVEATMIERELTYCPGGSSGCLSPWMPK
jgi:hypothetical protein